MRPLRLACLAVLVLLPATATAGEPGLAGRIVTDDDAPLARAKVTLHQLETTASRLERELLGESNEPVAGALTDNEGRFFLRVPSADLWLVRVEAAGFMPRVAEIKPLTDLMEVGDVAVSPSEPLIVRTLDEDGAALAGSTVYAATDRSRRFPGFGIRWWTPSRIGVTGEDGSVTLQRGRKERVRVAAARQGRTASQRRGVLGSGATLTLSRGMNRELQVVDALGRPASGVAVVLADDPIPLGRTDDAGRLSVTIPKDGAEVSVYENGLALWSGDVSAARNDEPAAFEIELRELRTMAGRVIDAKTREPLAGAVVWDETLPGISAVTDGSGQFALQGPASHRLRILAGAVGYLRPFGFDFPLTGDGRPGPTIALDPAAAVSGRVVNADGGPVPGATVSLSERQSMGTVRIRSGMPVDIPDAVTDEQGRFRVASVDPELNYDIEAEAEGFAPTKEPVGDLRPHETVSGLTLTLDAGRTIRGSVVDEDGNAIADARLTTMKAANSAFGGGMIRLGGDIPTSNETFSGADGAFAVAGLAKGKFDLTAKRGGFASKKVAGIDLEDENGVDLGEITLLPGESVEGLVLDSDGAPVEGAEIRVTESSPMSGLLTGMSFGGETGDADAVADPSGWFAVTDLSTELKYTVTAGRPGFVAAQIDGLTVPRTEPLEFRLQPSSRISGTVLDPAGEPIAGAQVDMTRMRGVEAGGMAVQIATREDTVSDADGRFAFLEQEPGKVSLTAVASGFQEAKLADLAVPKGEDLEGVEIRLEQGAIVQGRVLTPDGRPAIGASVGKVRGGPGFGPGTRGSAPVDGDGYYRLEGLAPGELSIEAEHPEYPRVAKDVALRTGINAVNLAFEGGHEVSGRVVDATGKPVAAAVVQTMQTGQYWGNAQTQTQSDGGFTLAGVQDGDYTLHAEAEGFASSRDQKITVAGQALTGLEIVLDHGTRVVGRVSGLEPEDYDRVTIRSMGAFDFHGASVDREGRFRIDNLAPGDHELVGTLTDSARRATTQVEIEPGVPEVAAELVFDTGLTLSGRVSQAGVPIAGATITASSSDQDRSGWSQTDVDGVFSMDGLVPGSYEVTVREFRSGLAHNETVEVATSREIQIEIPSAAVRGTVVDATDRQPLAGVQLLLTAVGETPRGFMPLHSATSDSTGRFELPAIADGTWELSAEKSGYAARRETVQVRHERSEDDVRLSLEPTEGISLEVRMPSGAPPDEVRLAVLSGETALVAGSYATGENGSVRVSTVPAGQWDVLVSAPGTSTSSFRVQAPGPKVPVQLAPATRLTVEVPELIESGLPATVKLSGSDGRPYRTLGWSGLPQSSWQMRGGREVLTLPPGDWTVQVADRDGRVWSGTTTTTPGAEATLVLGGGD